MHRLPELLVAIAAVIVLVCLVFFIATDTADRASPPPLPPPPIPELVEEPRQMSEAVISPIDVPPLPPQTMPALPHQQPEPALPAGHDKRRQLGGLLPIAIVIDDCGLSDTATRAAIALPSAITLSFLPYGRNAASLARFARADGHDIMLHMPMQPMGSADPGPNALTVDLDDAAIAARVAAALESLPPVVGLNNHMGSRFTADSRALAPVMREIARRRIFFLDSITSPRSVGLATAREAGIPALARDVFLDDKVSEAETDRQLAHAEMIARKRGSAIAIGHPHPSTLRAINRWLTTLEKRGFRLVPVRTLLHQENAPRP